MLKDTMPKRLQKISLVFWLRNRAIISDILLWVVLVMAVAAGIYFFGIVLPNREGQTIVLSFQDANEISKGSAVQLMGTEIGFVDDIRIRRDHVDIKVQTYPGTLKIPSHSTFTILFTGLAGAKSIEVTLPDAPRDLAAAEHSKRPPVYYIEQPVRMYDALNAAIDITQALQKGAENIADFFGKRKPVEELQFNIRQTHAATAAIIKSEGKAKVELTQLRQDIDDNAGEALSALQEIQPGMDRAVVMMTPYRLRQQAYGAIHATRTFDDMLRLHHTLGGPSVVALEQQLTSWNQMNAQVGRQLQQAENRVAAFPLQGWLTQLEQRQTQVHDMLGRLMNWTLPGRLDDLKALRLKIQGWNQVMERLLLKFNGGKRNPPVPGSTSVSAYQQQSALPQSPAKMRAPAAKRQSTPNAPVRP